MQYSALNQSILQELFEYDPLTGRCTWNYRNSSHIPNTRSRASWNAKNAGKEVGYISRQSGYRQTAIFGKQQQLHRLIWLYVYGEEPDNIDHINSIRDDNRLLNLRSVSFTDNNRNARKRTDNKTGVTGVQLVKSGKWLVRIRVDGKLIIGGTFSDFQEAVTNRLSLENTYGFHRKHGKK